MSLGLAEIRQVLAEIGPSWTGAQIQKVHGRGPGRILLGLRQPGRSGTLIVSVVPGRATLYVADELGPRDADPTAFCMLLRRLLRGRRLEGLELVEGDRVVRIQGPSGALIAEMTGRRGALVALDQRGLVVGIAGEGGPPRAGLVRGAPYAPPVRQEGRADGPSRLSPGRASEEARRLDEGAGASADAGERRREALGRVLAARLAKARKLASKVEADLERAGDPDALGRQGELLKLALGRPPPRGATSVEVEDLFAGSGERVVVPLDPTTDLRGNVERLFSRVRKARRARETAGARLAELRASVESLEASLEELVRTEPGPLLDALAARLGLEPCARGGGGRRGRAEPRVPYTEFRASRGGRILVGRSAADNDSLTLHVARLSDLWLHARGVTGSHVVVPLARGEALEPETLVDAATLAAHFSAARGEARVEVSYTPRRYVRKPKGSPPGQVVVEREKVLLLVLEPPRLARLLGGSGPRRAG